MRILQALAPTDPRRPYYEHLFQAMAARLKGLQRPDVFWSPSLLADAGASPPESSGTGFFVYGLAYGVRAELLARGDYEPAIRAGWAALVGAVQPDGMIGWVQQVSDHPDDVLASDTQLYGAAENRQGFRAIFGGTPDAVTGEAHGAKPDAVDTEVAAEGNGAGQTCRYFLCVHNLPPLIISDASGRGDGTPDRAAQSKMPA